MSTSITTAAILTAAGSGSRLGREVPKALVLLAGEPLLVHAARRLVASGEIDTLVVAAPTGLVTEVRAVLAAASLGVPVEVVAGGVSRQASVASALAVLPATVDLVLVHDAARALTPVALVTRVVAAVRAGHPAVVPGVPVSDTIKQVSAVAEESVVADADGGAPVLATVNRERLRAVQTPQGFDRALLDRAHTAGMLRAATEATAATDDAALVEAVGVAVWLVAGEQDAFKITTGRDLALAELVLADAVAGAPPEPEPDAEPEAETEAESA